MKRVVREQRLALVATVCPDDTPNLSPKGTIAVWGDEHLVFADIRSPRTVANLRANPAVEVNVVDPIARTGYRFRLSTAVWKFVRGGHAAQVCWWWSSSRWRSRSRSALV
jgi:uncharacterized protein